MPKKMFVNHRSLSADISKLPSNCLTTPVRIAFNDSKFTIFLQSIHLVFNDWKADYQWVANPRAFATSLGRINRSLSLMQSHPMAWLRNGAQRSLKVRWLNPSPSPRAFSGLHKCTHSFSVPLVNLGAL